MWKRQMLMVLGGPVLLVLAACAPVAEGPPVEVETAEMLPEPIVTVEGGEAGEQTVDHGEWILDVDEERMSLHAQHHPHGVLDSFPFSGGLGQ